MASFRDQFFYSSSSQNSSFVGSGIQQYPVVTNNSISNGFEFDESEIWNNTSSFNNTNNNNLQEQFSNQINNSSFTNRSSSSSYQSSTIPIPITTSSRLRKSASTINRNGSNNNRKKVGSDNMMTSSPPSSNYMTVQPPPTMTTSSSLPVNIPDWSKIMGQYNPAGSKNTGGLYYQEDEDGEEADDRVPPHEYTARQLARRSGMMVAFSVHEGVGRTLKGRDLSRVRNAIWKQTGFED